MKKYKVNVNGSLYEIEVELMSEEEVKKSKKQNNNKTEEPKQATPAKAGEGTNVISPMPGTILSVNIKEGDSVKKGQVLMILEAMKMENEIMASEDGTVTAVCVSGGQSVETGTVLCTIK